MLQLREGKFRLVRFAIVSESAQTEFEGLQPLFIAEVSDDGDPSLIFGLAATKLDRVNLWTHCVNILNSDLFVPESKLNFTWLHFILSYENE